MIDNENRLARLMEQARTSLSDHYDGAPVQIDGPIQIRDNSVIFHARIDVATPLEAAVKHCLLPKTNMPNQEDASQQFAALERVHHALAVDNSRFTVPAPLYLDDKLATYAMSWVDGESVSKKLRHTSAFFKGPGWLVDIGAWLGAFHQAGPIRTEPMKLNERLAVVDDLCASALPHATFSRANRLLQNTASSLQNTDTKVSWLHGDCKTDNFILVDNQIFGIDISLTYENPVEYDLAQFLNNLSLMLSSPKYLHVSGLLPHLEKAFWRGYQATGPSVSQDCLNWLRLLFSMSLWHTMLHRQRLTIRNRILNMIFARLTHRLCGEIGLSGGHVGP